MADLNTPPSSHHNLLPDSPKDIPQWLPGHQPLPPHMLQLVDVRRKHFDTIVRAQTGSISYMATVALGLHTYADILSLGIGGLQAHARAIAVTLPPRALSAIQAATFRMTRHRIPATQTPIDGLYAYYEDITYASPVVALPFKSFYCYQHLGLTSHHQETIGSLQRASERHLARYALQAQAQHAGDVMQFATAYLPNQVIPAFNEGQLAARAALRQASQR